MKAGWAFPGLFLILMISAGASYAADVTPTEAWRLIGAGALLVDVRDPEEYNSVSGHLPNAINIPVAQISSRTGELGDKSRSIVLYCSTGSRADTAAKTLRSMGFANAVNGGSYLVLLAAMPAATPTPTETVVAFTTTPPDGTPVPTATPTTPPTPTVTPTPTGCGPMYSCINLAVPTAIADCLSAHDGCVVARRDSLAVTAQQLASRAVLAGKCSRKKTRAACTLCYTRAKKLLRSPYDRTIFRGLLAKAIGIIEAERKAACVKK